MTSAWITLLSWLGFIVACGVAAALVGYIAQRRAAHGVQPSQAQSLPEMGIEELASACLSYRHDFGLLPQDERLTLLSDAAAWAHALGFPIKRGTAGAMKAASGVAPAAFYLATHDEVTPTEGNEPRVLKREHVDSYVSAGWKVTPALVAVCPECEAAHGVSASDGQPKSTGGTDA